MFLYEVILRAAIKREINKLLAAGGQGRQLYTAFEKFLNNEFTEDQKNDFRKIENIRRKLYVSTQTIAFTDYGAGSSGLKNLGDGNKAPVISERNLGKLSRKASKSEYWCRFIAAVAGASSPPNILELGTCVGISAMYIAAGLNRSGKLVTIEGAESLAEIASENFREAGFQNIELLTGRFSDKLPELLNNSEFGLCFIDGDHKKQSTLDYYKTVSSKMKSGGIIIFDDIAWSKGMRDAWKTIVRSPRITKSINLFEIGLTVIK